MRDVIEEAREAGFHAGCEWTRNLEVPAWQTIDSAPKDGSAVLLMDDMVIVNGEYHERGEDSYWFFYSDHMEEPTHWMPLPNPPKEEGKITCKVKYDPNPIPLEVINDAFIIKVCGDE